jgi:hypothetical protein
MKVFCDHFDGFNSFGEFLSGQPSAIHAEQQRDTDITVTEKELVSTPQR